MVPVTWASTRAGRLPSRRKTEKARKRKAVIIGTFYSKGGVACLCGEGRSRRAAFHRGSPGPGGSPGKAVLFQADEALGTRFGALLSVRLARRSDRQPGSCTGSRALRERPRGRGVLSEASACSAAALAAYSGA